LKRELPWRACLLVLALVTSCAGAEDQRLSLVLITADTTRADALGCLGGSEEATPQLDALAEQSVLYTEARTVTPMTMPSHASMFTGLYPPRHTVRDNNFHPLPSTADTLAERARKHGYETAAFTSSVAVDRSVGLAQGFDLYDEPKEGKKSAFGFHAARDGKDTVRAASKWLLGRESDAPFFLWVHLFDPHKPYTPPKELRRKFRGDPYAGEVADMDAAIGRLLENLRKTGALERSIVVVVGDHGEGLGDHGEDTHSAYCYASTMRVPMMIRYPGGHRAGTRCADLVSVVDLYPTLLEVLELGPPGDVDGISLHDRAVPEERGVYFESFFGYLAYGWSPLSGWASRDGVYLHSSKPLFMPPEDIDGGGREPSEDERDIVRTHLQAIGEVASRPALEVREERVDEELLESLRALGYAAVGLVGERMPHPFEVEGRPSPHERTVEHKRSFRAADLHQSGRTEAAITILKDLVEKNPDNLFALENLVTCLTQEKRWEEALEPARRLVEDGARDSRGPFNLAIVLRNVGMIEESKEYFRLAVETDPHNEKVVDMVARIYEADGDLQEAAEIRKLLED
jgi:hypothetical protein